MSVVQGQEAAVRAAFDAQACRFKDRVGLEDERLRALIDALMPGPGRRLLELGCGKGRFAARLRERGAEVFGLDLSAAMLGGAPTAWDRVRASARRLPIAPVSIDGIFAVEVFQHLTPRGIDEAIAEARRVLRPGGRLAIVDRNARAFDACRPWLPALAVKWIDERRGRWMYPPGGPARERWFWPGAFRDRLATSFETARVSFLLAPDEANLPLFRAFPGLRRMAIWVAEAPGGVVDG